MNIQVLFNYHKDVVPPRCRKPRRQYFSESLSVSIRAVTAEEAPVAMIARGAFPFRESSRFIQNYRSFGGRLWVNRNLENDGTPCGRTNREDDWWLPTFPSKLDIRQDHNRNDAYRYFLSGGMAMDLPGETQRINAWADEWLIIDGKPHRAVSEPRYVAQTFGLGSNHGGTALFVTDHYNPNLRADRYFNLKDREAAIACAESIAKGRGDTQSYPIRPHGPRFEILLPDALRFDPKQIVNGAGDPFFNRLDAVSQATGGNPIVGVLALTAELAHGAPFKSWREGGTTDFGSWRPGAAIESLGDLKVGDVLFADSEQFNALNLAEVTGFSSITPDIAYGRFVDPEDVTRLRIGADPSGFAWHSGIDLKPNPDGRPKLLRAVRT